MAILKQVLVQLHNEPHKKFLTEVSVDQAWNSIDDYPEMFYYFGNEKEFEQAKQTGDNGYEFRILWAEEEEE